MISRENIEAARKVTGEISVGTARSVFLGHTALPSDAPRDAYEAIYIGALQSITDTILAVFEALGGADKTTLGFVQSVAIDDFEAEYRRLQAGFAPAPMAGKPN